VIKDKTDVFIGLVKLNEQRECRSARDRASTKIACVSATFCLVPGRSSISSARGAKV
jgi:hypothetical protein